RQGASIALLTKTIGVSRQTLYRDLKILIESPLPIRTETVNGEARYFLDDKEWKGAMPTPLAMSLALARESLRGLEGTHILEDLDRALRLAAALPPNQVV